jgi:TonB family protein
VIIDMSFLMAQASVSIVVLLSAAVVCALLRCSSAAQRHFVWSVALMSLLLIPLMSFLVSPWVAKRRTEAGRPMVIVTTESAGPVAQGRPVSAAVPWQAILTGVWLMGAGFFLIRVGAGFVVCLHRKRRSIEFQPANRIALDTARRLGLNRNVVVRQSLDISLPEAFGLRRPTVLLPPAVSSWSTERLRVVLLHELVHIQRHDWATHVAARLAVSLFWFNPLAWHAIVRLQHERELACDDAVIRSGVPQSEYAHELVEIARLTRAESPALAVAMARPSHLERRIRAILNPHQDRRSLVLKHRILTLFPAVLFIITASLFTAPAQTGSASIAGTVRDPSGAVVPAAEVVLSAAKGQEMIRTNDAGEFNFSGFPDGKYSLKVMKPGFRVFEQKDVEIKAAAPLNVSIPLEMGRISERLEVAAQGQARPQPDRYSTVLQPAAAEGRSAPMQTVSVAAPNGPRPQRIRVGGNVQPSKLVNRVPPQYPAHLIAQGVEGTVLLQAVIGTKGQMLGLQATNSQVHPELVQATLDAVKQWQYEPTLLNGQPVEIITTVRVDFRLTP